MAKFYNKILYSKTSRALNGGEGIFGIVGGFLSIITFSVWRLPFGRTMIFENFPDWQAHTY